MRTDCSNIYILSFNAGADAGLAIVSAYSEKEAFRVLKNSGRYNGVPEAYSLIQCKDMGISTTITAQLLLETYTNALGAFDAFIKYLNKYVGPKGDKGLKGDKGDIGDTGDRGTSILHITTAPSAYSSEEEGYIPSFRIHLAAVKNESGASEVVPGDILEQSFYHYPVGLVRGQYVYLGPRVSIRGEQGERIPIDSVISDTSTNAVENRVIKSYISDVTSDFITNSVSNLTNYYLKGDTYTRQEIESLIAAIQHFHYEIYANTSQVLLPSASVLYLIGPTGSGNDKYEEYVYDSTRQDPWVKIGDTSIDLSGYAEIGEVIGSVTIESDDPEIPASVTPIKNLQESGAVFYPTSHEKGVLDDEGVTLSEKLGQMNSIMDNLGMLLTAVDTVVNSLSSNEVIIAWGGDSVPYVPDIPAGVNVEYNGTTYTGTLVASSSTAGKTYLVGNDVNDSMMRYVSAVVDGNYVWMDYGSTDIDLSDYIKRSDEVWLTQSQFERLVIKDPTKTYNVYEESAELT